MLKLVLLCLGLAAATGVAQAGVTEDAGVAEQTGETADAGLPDMDELFTLYEQLLAVQFVGLETPVLGRVDTPPPCASGRSGVTRGLLVAADQWTGHEPSWLQGPVNDVAFLRNAMVARGAEAENLHMLLGDGATRAGFDAAAAQVLAATGCGDSVVLHISGWAFGAEIIAPSLGDGGPFDGADIGPTLAELAARSLEGNRFDRLAAAGPFVILNQSAPGVADVLSPAALSDYITALRNRGADVTVILDTSDAEALRLEDRQAQVDPARLWRETVRAGSTAPVAPPVMLSAGAGAMTVYYGTGIGELTVEMLLPRGAADRRYYGVFSFRLATALLQAERTSPPALSRMIATLEADGQVDRQWTHVFSTTDPERDLIAESRPPASQQKGSIRIIDPAPTRAAARMDTPRVTLRGQVQAAAETMIVTVNGQTATSAPDGSFSHEIALQAGVNRIDVLAMTRDNQPVTHSFELYFEGDMAALRGSGTRYALLIANQDYPEGSGLAPLETPIGDAEALAALLTADYGFVTEAVTPEGEALPLFLRNAGRIEIETALYQISRIAGAQDTVLIFYAGHGIYEQATQGAFWLPVDARAGLPFSYLPAAAITDAILRIEAGSVLVISDSCYSGALLRGEAVAEAVEGDRLRALQRLAAKRSRIVIASGGNEPVLDGGGDGHSLFARALLTGLAEMEDEAFSARELFDRYLLPMVVGQAAQEPQYRPIDRAGHEGGDVVLARVE
jgi:hypothetical protein